MKKLCLLLLVFLVMWMPVSWADAPPRTPAHAERIAVGGEGRWDYLEIDEEGGRLFLAHGSRTDVIDTRSSQVIGTIAGTNGVHGVAIARDLGLGFTSNGRNDSVSVFELSSLRVLRIVNVGGNPDAIVYEPRSRRIVTFNGRSRDATVIDAVLGNVVATIPIGGKPEFARAADDGNVYFNVQDTHELAVIDPAAARLTHRYSLFPCENPTGLALDTLHRVYSVCENKIMMVSAFDGTRLAQVAIGPGADGVVWDRGFAYSANGGDGTISVVRAGAEGVASLDATWPSQPGARTIAVDRLTHRLFLPTAVAKPGETGRGREWMEDSLYVLVFGLQR